jgi:hypothetical protein
MRQSPAFRRVRRAAAVAGPLLGIAAAGCYQYVPIRLEAARPNEDVRVRVTEPAAARLLQDFGAFTTELDGQLASAGSDSVSISVAIGREYRGMTLDSTSQVVRLSRADLVDVRRRTFSRSRTVLAGALAIGAFGVLVGTVVQMGDPNTVSPDPPPPPPSPFRGVLLRIPLP